jgi:hypothetical protein
MRMRIPAPIAPALACIAAFAAAAPAQERGSPYRDDFATIDPSWERRVDTGATFEAKDGGANFDAPAGARAHILRPAGGDAITLTGKLSRWASLYLVWDADNWCSVGQVSPTPFGRFYSSAVVAGEPAEVDHRGIGFGSPYLLRIRLGSNFVRFESSFDGKRWTELRTIERPSGYAGAPKWIGAGRYYAATNKPFADADALMSVQGDAIRYNGRVAELRVEPTPAGETTLGDAELQALRQPRVEVVNGLLAKNDDDPTYEAVVDHYPPMVSPREVVGVPDHPLDIGVDRLGRLDVSPWTPPLAWFEVGDPPAPLGREGVPFARRLLHGYLPILTLNLARDGVDYELTVFGWSEGFRADKDLHAYARLTARTEGGTAPPKQLALAWGDGKQRHRWTPSAADKNQSRWFLKFKYPNPDAAAPIAEAEFDGKAAEVVDYWEKLLARAGRLDIPDPRVNEAYRAWIVYSLLNTDEVNGFPEPHDGAGFYEEMFGNSVSLHTLALNMYGLHDRAARVLGTQIHFQQPDGLYTQVCGLTDPGAFLYGLAKHYRVTADREWLKGIAPNILKQCEWLIRQRAEAPKEGMLRGLIKFRPYNDYPDPVYNYLGNVWCVRGMEEAAAALKEIDAPEADSIAAEAVAYRKDVMDSMAASAFADKGQTLLPMEPDTRRLLKLSKNQGGDYYGLIASPLLGTEFLPIRDERTDWIVDIMEKRNGLIAGLCEFQGGIDHAYTYGYLMNAMKRGEERKTLLGFWSMLAFGMTRDTYSPVEVTQIATGDNHFTLPHLYSCTDQLRLLRNMMHREEGNTLRIGDGIPRAWLEPGKHVAATAAPTEFGELGYRIDANADGSIRVRIDPPRRNPPSEIRVRLRHPSRKPIAAATATPRIATELDGDAIVIRDLKAPVDLQVRFRAD